MAPKAKNPVAGTPRVLAAAKKATHAPSKGMQSATSAIVTATPVTMPTQRPTIGGAASTTSEKSPAEKVKVQAKNMTFPIPTTAKKQPRVDEPAAETQPPQKKTKKPAAQIEAGKRVAKEIKKKVTAEVAKKKKKALEEAQMRAIAVEKRRAALEAERKRIEEEEEARMAEEEAERLREEEALAASMASEEQLEEQPETEEEGEDEYVEEVPAVAQPEEVAQPGIVETDEGIPDVMPDEQDNALEEETVEKEAPE